MSLKSSMQSFIRYLQGERPGMRAGLGAPTRVDDELALLLPSILIQTSVQLVDVSFWQREINFVVMKAAGIAGVIIRAGQRNWEDIRFKENWRKAKEAGLPRGSYWFYDSREDPKKQAALWWSLIRDDPGELVHVADFEEAYGGSYGTKAHMKEFLLEFQRLSGLPDSRIAVYTGYFWWYERVGNDPFFKRFALWLAWYAIMSLVRVPLPWMEPDLLFWQYTASGDGTAYGAGSLDLDLNWYVSDLAAFSKRFNLGSSEPPTGDPMADYIYSITPTGSLGSKVRPEPDTGNTPLTITLPFGKFAYGNRRITIAEDKYEGGIQVNKAGDVWLEVLEVNGVQLTTPAYIAEIHKGERWGTIKQIGTIPPPPAEPALPDLPVTVTVGDDVTYAKQTVNLVLKPK